MTIPNIFVALLIASFAVGYAAIRFSGAGFFQPLSSHILAGGAVLIVTFAMFSLRMIGGGDSKLAAAFALWVGLSGLPVFLFYMAIGGAGVAAAALVLKRRTVFKNPAEKSWIARVQAGESVVPYGIPITFGALMAFINLGYLSPENLALFLMSN